MNDPVRSFAAHSASGRLVPFQLERRNVRPEDVAIAVLHCGVCHSDLHNVRNDWGNATYPMVPGHEIVGRVIGTGVRVTRFKPGDLVGVGCMVDACTECACCQAALEQYCTEGPTLTYNGVDRVDGSRTQGGYSTKVVVTQAFVLKIPPGLDLAGTAPLLCAGITTWSPLRHWQVGPGSRVAVIGLGGLGHMALKLAHALGAEVTLFSRSPGKEADARRLGAHHVVISTDAARMAAVAGHFHLIIDTVPVLHDINPYLPALRVDGTLVVLGYMGPLADFNTGPLVFGRRRLAGSLIGGIAETQEMLNFCGKHGITADIEVIRINEAFERLLRADVKYRFVIDMHSINDGAAG